MKLLLRITHGLLAALFICAAALQYNDTDIVRWVAIYLAAASVCIFAAINRPNRILAATVALIALAWAMIYFAHGAWKVPYAALWSEWEMKDQTIVAGREMNGLFMIFICMALAWATGKKPTTVAASN